MYSETAERGLGTNLKACQRGRQGSSWAQSVLDALPADGASPVPMYHAHISNTIYARNMQSLKCTP